MMIRMIAFDGDDTLWDNEEAFGFTQAAFRDLLRPYHSPEWIDARLLNTERKNIAIFGYGAKGFALSMIETAIELSEGRITGGELQVILDAVFRLLRDPVRLLQDVLTVLDKIGSRYPLLLVTKGDLFEQESKVARSGIADRFSAIEIVSEKTVGTYATLLDKHNVRNDEFIMVGNSMKSDILPVLELGAYAVHIPYTITWEHEVVKESVEHPKLLSLQRIIELPALIERIGGGQ